MNSFLKYNLPALVWAVVILWLSMADSGSLPTIKIPNIDKAVHFVFYVLLAALMFFGWTRQHLFLALHRHRVFGILALAIAYGIFIELMQERFTLNRHFEWLDVAADSVGTLVGTIISVKLFK